METKEQNTKTSSPLLTVFVCGITNTGKSTLIADIQKDIDQIQGNEAVADKLTEIMGPGYLIKSGAIHVGREMRKLFPPEKFQGKGAMKSTEKVALGIYNREMRRFSDCDLVLVDGQPRMRSQIPLVLEKCSDKPINRFFVFLNCSDAEIDRRIRKRDGKGNSNSSLSNIRKTNDKIQLYDVITDLLAAREYVACIDSTSPQEQAVVIRSIVSRVLVSKLTRDIENQEGLPQGAAAQAAQHIIAEALSNNPSA